jgi:hypothetical protein
MSKIFPQPYDLPSGSQPWAREVQSRIEQDERNLESTRSELLASTKGLGATVQSVSEQLVTQQELTAVQQETITDLKNRYVAVNEVVDAWDTPSLINDGVWRDYGAAEFGVTIDFPGPPYQLIVTFGHAQMRVDGRAGTTVLVEQLIEIPGYVSYGPYVARVTAGGAYVLGVPAIATVSFTPPAGTYTVNTKTRIWCDGTGTDAWVRLISPYVMAEVAGAL